MKKRIVFSFCFFISCTALILFMAFSNTNEIASAVPGKVNYLPLGDSYTIGTGTSPENCWPKVLTGHLNDAGISTVYLGNPARNGFSTQDLIDYELPVLEKSKADFVTLLIGVNDWVRGVDKSTYEKNYEIILNAVQKKLGSNKKRIVLVTIPDFGLTSSGKNYGNGRDISSGISEFNEVIKSKGKKFGLPVADIFPVSLNVVKDSTLTASDGLHPSAAGYAEWEKVIFPVVSSVLKK